MIFLDASVQLGRPPLPAGGVEYGTEQIVERLRLCGISGAMVTHCYTGAAEMMFGNAALLEETASRPTLFPVWGVAPDVVGRRSGADVLSKARRQGVKALWALDRAGPTNPEYWRNLLRLCGKQGFPVILQHAPDVKTGTFPKTDLTWAERMAQQAPKTRFILLRPARNNLPNLIPLLETCRNICVELSGLHGPGTLEILTERFGARRLLFGSGLPWRCPGACRALVAYADLPESDKALIAGKNLANLLDITMSPEQEPVLTDDIARCVIAGKPLSGVTMMDVHVHLGSEKAADGIKNGFAPCGKASDIIRQMDRIGTRRAAVSHLFGVFGYGGQSALEELCAVQRAHPERFIGYAHFNPNYPDDLDAVMKQQLECRLPGLKPYTPFHGQALTAQAYERWWQFADRHHLFVLCHVENGTAAQVADLSCRFQRANWVLAHAGMNWGRAGETAAVAAERENVFLDFTYGSTGVNVLERLAEIAGADKVLFGTDYPIRDMRQQLGWLAFSKLPGADKKAILGNNFARILKQATWDSVLNHGNHPKLPSF